ncbi:MAG: NUDIX hydrolase [Candidatus Sungbacteria bacterium]|nr:NUDIX hydrolase [Candidatus Sungbacteria bacterium]
MPFDRSQLKAPEARSAEESDTFINVGVVINDRKEVLMVRRVKEEQGTDGSVLRWVFPGGKQRYAESREECVKREVLAETGYAITPLRQISLRSHPQFKLLFIAYHLCHLEHPEPVGELKEPHEIAEIRWVKHQEVEQLVTTNLDPNVKKELGYLG